MITDLVMVRLILLTGDLGLISLPSYTLSCAAELLWVGAPGLTKNGDLKLGA